jgi:elongation factor Ts
MAEVTLELIKTLREATGVGMMDCKRALQETNGDYDAAVDWLRAKGLSKAAKKADRIAAEGLVAVAVRDDGAGQTGAAVEFNAETDFVSRNEIFQNAARKIAKVALDNEGVEAIGAGKTDDGETVQDFVTNLIATIGENMMVRRSARFTVSQGVVATYIHNAVAPDLGRIAVLVALEGAGDKAKLTELGRKIGMHIAATRPIALSVDEIDPAVVAKEREVFTQQAIESGKPPQVAEKMVEGRLRKFYEEVVLPKQAFVMNPDQTIEQFVEQTAKELGSPIRIAGFVNLALGEGVEKKSEDFAAEVAAAAAGQA